MAKAFEREFGSPRATTDLAVRFEYDDFEARAGEPDSSGEAVRA